MLDSSGLAIRPCELGASGGLVIVLISLRESKYNQSSVEDIRIFYFVREFVTDRIDIGTIPVSLSICTIYFSIIDFGGFEF